MWTTMLCSLGMQQCTNLLHPWCFAVRVCNNAQCTIQKTTFFELGDWVDLLMMASAQVVKTSVNTNNSPSQDYTTNPDDHSNHNIDSPGFKPFTVIFYAIRHFIFFVFLSNLTCRVVHCWRQPVAQAITSWFHLSLHSELFRPHSRQMK